MNTIFLNTAAISTISKETAQSVSQAILALSEQSPDVRGWIKTLEQCRRSVAKLFGSSGAESIAFLQNTSSAISAVAEGLQWNHGDEIIMPSCEYPANQYPWINLERKGVVVIPAEPNPEGGLEWEDFEPYISGKTKLIAFSHVQFRTGYRCDIQRIASECQARNILTLADVIQSAGLFELKQESWGIDFMVAGSQKWIQAPPGIGFLSVKPSLIKKLTPVFTGAFSVKNPHDVSEINLDFQDDGHRFESGTMNFIVFYGLLQALSECTPKASEQQLKRAKQLRHGLTYRGFTVLGSEKSENQSGIISFTHDTIDIKMLFNTLTSEGVTATYRDNSIRFAPSRQTSADQIEELFLLIDSQI